MCLFQVEKRLELVKQVSHSTHKKLTACLQGQQGVDLDKKSVRSPSVRLRDPNVAEHVKFCKNYFPELPLGSIEIQVGACAERLCLGLKGYMD